MIASVRTRTRTLLAGSALALSLAVPPLSVAAQDAPILQPGAPGQQTRPLEADEAIRLADTSYIAADIAFMQDMIHHHYQAVEMARLAEARATDPLAQEAAKRILASQTDEIAFMQDWLRQRGQDAPDPVQMPNPHAHHMMKGMATPAQMAELANLSGSAFDRQFLTLMIAHHEGALDMVDDLLRTSGSAYDPVLARFVNDVRGEQSAEIGKMNIALGKLNPDPRATLAAGLTDAGMAMKGMRLISHLPKPTGFFDPANPGGLQPVVPPRNATANAATAEAEADEAAPSANPQDNTQFGSRYSLLSFWNTDMAFSGDMLVAGNYHGFNIYRLGEDGVPALQSSVVCPGGQGDVSIAGNLLVMSVEQERGRVDCGLQGVNEDVSAERFRGLRIFDISDPMAVRQVGQVQTCRGSHTHSIVSQDARRLVVYNSGTAGVREEEELPGCVGNVPGDPNTALFRIDVIEIPVADPAASRIVSSPGVFADPESGVLAGLWRGGNHGEGTQSTNRTDQCHDITVFPAKNIAAGACSGNGIVLDIRDPLNPKRIDDVTDKGFAYWHSATFNNDGTKVIFTDEWGGGARPRCRSYDPMNWGADAIYDIENGNKLAFRSNYKLPAPQGEKENCVAHNGSIVPVPGRDIFVQAWYQGGISLIDFTDSANPVEIGYFDRGPVDDQQGVLGGFWSVYYYDGHIYGTEITRGLDTFALEPSEYLTANEIAAAALADTGGVFNPQTQVQVTWPDSPVVARAYIDQMQRMEPMPEAALSPYYAALEAAERGDGSVADTLDRLADDLSEGEALPRKLAATMRGIAEGLRNGG